MIKKNAYLGVILLCLGFIVSCEKDFQDIGTNIIKNDKFDTEEVLLDIELSQKEIESVRADNIALSNLGQYLFGVYNKPNAKKIEASIVSQLGISTTLKVVDKIYGTDTTVVTTIDEVILKIPLQATSIGKESDGKPKFRIDSLLGKSPQNFTVNIYESNTFLNRLDPNTPSKKNSYQSNAPYSKVPTPLNTISDFNFLNAEKDTMFVFDRNLSNGNTFKDTLKIKNGSAIKTNPFKIIKLNKNRFKTDFLDKYGTSDFASQDAFNDYFKGLIIEASGNDGALVPLNLSNQALTPSINILYTNTILKGASIVDTIAKNDSFKLSGIKNSVYETTSTVSNTPNSAIIQGTSGSMVNIKILSDAKLQELRANNWLINDASLTFYINSNIDTTNTPKRLFLYKNGETSLGKAIPSQISDLFTEGPIAFGGTLEYTSKKPNKYTFRITNYVSNLLDGSLNYLPKLGLRVFNTTDLPTSASDTIVRSYNWNPRSVPILDNSIINGEKRAQLKISYTVKK